MGYYRIEVSHLLGIATLEHLGSQTVVIGGLIARMGVFKRVPVIGKDLLEDAPVPRGFGHHRVAPSWGVGQVAVQPFYHA